MHKILIVTNLFHPDRGGGAAVFSDFCYELSKRGFDIIVRCAYPYYPEWVDKSGKNGWKIERIIDRGVRVERYGFFIPSKPNSLMQRILYESSFLISISRSLFNLLRNQSFDMVIVYCPLIGSVVYASLFKFLFKKPVFLNVQDLSAEAAEAAGISKNRIVNKIFRNIQSFFFNYADYWSTISPVMVDKLANFRKKDQPLHYFPNWTNQSLLDHINKLPSKVDYDISPNLNLLYAGNIGKKQGLLEFCKQISECDTEFKFRIHGDGGGAFEIENWIQKQNDKRFIFEPFLNEKKFAKAMYDADFFVITEKSGSGGSFIPSKMIPCISSATPVMAISDATSPLGQEMIQNDIGPWFSWDEVPMIPEFLKQIVNQNDKHYLWKKNALERSNFYNRNNIINQFESEFNRIIKKVNIPRRKWGQVESAGINRHRVGDEIALHKRSS